MSESTKKDVESSVSGSIREKLQAEEPSEERKAELREQHVGHLVRRTTSKLSMDAPEVGAGMDVEATAEIPDIYCFTCEEWVGVSGVELRGTPRSRSDAYYLGGMPTDVLHAKNGAAKTLNELADALIDRVSHLNNRPEALDFIKAEIEEMGSAERGEQR